MMPARGLGRQIVLAMVSTSLAGVFISVVGLYVFYALMFHYAPGLLGSEPGWWPSGVEWIAMAATGIMGAAIAARAAIRLTRRILTPLNSVATSVRRVANGELSARAVTDDRTMGEAAELVDDFNRMAANLEKASAGLAHWNAMIAHELRTPVTILRGRLQGLSEGVFAPDPALFRSLQLQAEGLARLIEDLRTVSLVESGHLDLVRDHVELWEELADVVEVMRPNLEAAGFSVSVEMEAGSIDVDPTRIRQALMALLDNAMRYATPGRLRVILRFDRHDARIEVVDEGPGLPSDMADDAFLPFRRLATIRETSPLGSGLGLTVVRAIAEAHGGDASYEGREGGSCFIIRLSRNIS